MCSSCIQIVFNILLAVAFVLTLVALFTPQWRNANTSGTSNSSSTATTVKGAISFGVALSGCSGSFTSFSSCLGWNSGAQDYVKATQALLALALMLMALAFVWSLMACCLCCFKSCLTWPLPILTGVACLFCIIAVIVYGVKSNADVNAVTNVITSLGSGLSATNNIGYSMVLAILGILALAADTIVGVILVKCSKVAPC